MKKISSNQIRLIQCLIIVAIFALSYQYIYMKYVDLTAKYDDKTKFTQSQIKQREVDLADEDTLKAQTVDLNSQSEKIIDSLPITLTKEDNLIFIENVEKDLKMDIPTVTFTDATTIFTTILPIRDENGKDIIATTQDAQTASAISTPDPAIPVTDTTVAADGTVIGTEAPQVMTGLQSSINVTFQTSYEKFKALVDYINTYPEKTSISNTTLSYDGSTGELLASMTINRYALTGTGKKYEEPYIGDISIGTDNIFGTPPTSNDTTGKDATIGEDTTDVNTTN